MCLQSRRGPPRGGEVAALDGGDLAALQQIRESATAEVAHGGLERVCRGTDFVEVAARQCRVEAREGVLRRGRTASRTSARRRVACRVRGWTAPARDPAPGGGEWRRARRRAPGSAAKIASTSASMSVAVAVAPSRPSVIGRSTSSSCPALNGLARNEFMPAATHRSRSRDMTLAVSATMEAGGSPRSASSRRIASVAA